MQNDPIDLVDPSGAFVAPQLYELMRTMGASSIGSLFDEFAMLEFQFREIGTMYHFYTLDGHGFDWFHYSSGQLFQMAATGEEGIGVSSSPIYGTALIGLSGGGTIQSRIAQIINGALKQPKLASCLHTFFGKGAILTNNNLPYLDASKNTLELGGPLGLPVQPVPPSGRSSVYVASDVVNNPFVEELPERVYLHETANALAYQNFTNVPYEDRPFKGPMGGPPTADQQVQATMRGDSDIGRQFEKCIFGSSLSGKN